MFRKLLTMARRGMPKETQHGRLYTIETRGTCLHSYDFPRSRELVPRRDLIQGGKDTRRDRNRPKSQNVSSPPRKNDISHPQAPSSPIRHDHEPHAPSPPPFYSYIAPANQHLPTPGTTTNKQHCSFLFPIPFSLPLSVPPMIPLLSRRLPRRQQNSLQLQETLPRRQSTAAT